MYIYFEASSRPSLEYWTSIEMFGASLPMYVARGMLTKEVPGTLPSIHASMLKINVLFRDSTITGIQTLQIKSKHSIAYRMVQRLYRHQSRVTTFILRCYILHL